MTIRKQMNLLKEEGKFNLNIVLLFNRVEIAKKHGEAEEFNQYLEE